MMRNKTRFLWLLVLAAPATPAPAGAAPCLTHQQARERFSGAHLYWHTDAHCWDNRRRGGDYERSPEPRSVSHDAKVPTDQAVRDVHATVFYPSLTVNTWPNQARLIPFDAHDMSRWPVLFDVDGNVRFDAWRERVTGTTFK